MEENQSPAPETKGVFAKEKRPLLIAIAAALVVILVVLAVVLLGGGRPQTVAEKFVKADFACDIEQLDKLCAYDFKEYLLGGDDGDDEEFFETMSDALDENIDSWKDLTKAYRSSRQDELEDRYGSYEVEIESGRVKELSVKKLESAIGEKAYEELEEFGFDPDKVKSGAEVSVKVKIKGEDGKDSYTETVYLAKIGGSWKVLNVSDNFFGGSPQAVAERFVKLCLDCEFEQLAKLCAYDLKAYLIDEAWCDDEDEFFEEMSDEFDADIDSWAELAAALREELREDLEDEYGKFELEIEAAGVRELSVREIKDEMGEWRFGEIEDFGFDPGKAEAYTAVRVNITIAGKEDSYTIPVTIYLAKIDGSWKALTGGDMFY